MKKKILLSILLTPLIFSSLLIKDNVVQTDASNFYNVFTLQPWYDELSTHKGDDKIALPENVKNQSELVVQAGKSLVRNLDNVAYKDEYTLKNYILDVNDFKAIGPNQIVMFQGHGSYVEGVGSVLWTKEDWDEEKLKDPDFKKEVDEGRIVNAEYHVAVTSKYIDYYCQNMNNSLIYLGQCLSGKDDILAKAFLAKGVTAVLGNSEAIQTLYGDIMQHTVITLLGQINFATNDYYTLKEALIKAKDIYGRDDSVLYPFANGARVEIFGDDSFQLRSIKTTIVSTNDEVYKILACILPVFALAVGALVTFVICKKDKKNKK